MPRNVPPGWRPGKDQAELFADMVLARLPIALIAERFGVGIATLRGYFARLAAADTYWEPSPLAPAPPAPPPVPVTTRITADRVFERGSRREIGCD
jgi:hypothetical protein